MKKITFLALHLGIGGIETSIINTCNALCDNYDIKIISFYKVKDDKSNTLNKNIKVKYIYEKDPNKKELLEAIKNKNILKIFKEGITSLNILYMKKNSIIKEIKKIDNGVIVSTRMEFNVLLSKYGNKDVFKIAQEHQHHNNDKKYINTIRTKYKNLNYLLALTNVLKEDYKKYLENTSIKVEYIPNMLVNNSKERSNLNTKNIISIGRFHKVKRFTLLLEVLSKLDKNIKLILIGDGEEKENIINKIEELKINDRVIMPGFLNSTEINKYFKESSLFVMTSSSEGLPMVLLEAMDMGIPCISFHANGGTKDIIDNGKNGFIIENDNIDEMKDKIMQLLNDREKLLKFSQNALKKVEKFSKKNVVKLWKNILN